MTTIAPVPETDAGEPDTFKPLTAEQARLLRERNPSVSPGWVVAGQIVLGLAGGLIAWLVSGRAAIGWSLLYGAFAVAVPAGVYARALARARASGLPVAAGVLGWGLVKIVLSVALLVVAPGVVRELSWVAVLVGVILATKMYGVAFALARRPRQRN